MVVLLNFMRGWDSRITSYNVCYTKLLRFDVQGARRITMGDVVFMLAEQTDGLIQPYEMWPLGCSHPLCSCGTQLIKDGNGFVPAIV